MSSGPGKQIIQSRLLSQFPQIIHGSSTLALNYKSFLKKLGIDPLKLVTTDNVHSTALQIVTKKDQGKMLKKTDGLATNTAQVSLGLYTADCVPIFLYAPAPKLIALLHCGWVGTAKGFAQKAIRHLCKKFALRPAKVYAYLGPSIGPCCYANAHHPERIKIFEKNLPSSITAQKHIDLKGANRLQLKEIGVAKIEVSPYCTSCRQNLFPSHRRQGAQRKRSILNIIGFK